MRRSSSFFVIILLFIISPIITAQQGETVTKTISAFRDQNGQYKESTISDTEVITTVSIVYTTIIYTATSSPLSPTSSVFSSSNTNPGYQEQSPTSNGQSLQESLQDDQQALKRMIMILSLVGGLGVIAVVATIVIFTRMRVKNKRQREMDDHDDDNDNNRAVSDQQLIPATTRDPPNSGGLVIHSASSLTSLSADSSDDRRHLEPSAPPATTMMVTERRRTLVSMSSQTTAPSPSAPTAKELDAMVDDVNSSSESSSHYHNSVNTCSRCAPLLLEAPPITELPPPAYTPSAPPHYVLPPEHTIISSPSPSMSVNHRRHSTGT